MERTFHKQINPNLLPIKDLLSLSKLLRKNGDKILNNSTKLVLTPSILSSVNSYLEVIIEDELSNSFDVLTSNYIQGDTVYSLQFLHDFFQKVPHLKVANSLLNCNLSHSINLKKFHSLECLELKNISILLVEGLQYLRKQLKVLKCIKSCDSLEDIFIKCGKDNPVKPFIWENLSEICLSNNNIRYIDDSLKFLPHLKILNLSQNQLHNDSFSNFMELPNLSVLDLSYNYLEQVPHLPTTTIVSVIILNLQNNSLQDFTGIQFYSNLEFINASYNCLSNHSHLLYLQELKCLKNLDLTANPVYYHPRHRALALLSLGNCVINEYFSLNGKHVSKSEINAVLSDGKVQGHFRPAGEFLQSLPSPISQIPNMSHASSVASSYNRSYDNKSPSKKTKSKKGAIIREPLIHSKDNDDDSSSLTTVSTCDTPDSMAHLRTKQKLEQLRNDYGQENWLYSKSGHKIRDILGFHSESNGVEVLDTEALEHHFIISAKINEYSTLKENSSYNDLKTSFLENVPKTSPAQSNIGHNKLEVPVDYESTGNDLQVTDTSLYSMNKSLSPEEVPSDDEENEQLSFTVERRLSLDRYQEVNLSISPHQIKEKPCAPGLVSTKWDSNALLSACLVSSNPDVIEVKFNTVVKTKQERYYKLTNYSPNDILSLLRPLISSKDHFEHALQCIKCSSVFSKDVAKVRLVTESKKWKGKQNSPAIFEEQICPNCGSNMLIVVEDEHVTPGQEILKKNYSQSYSESTIPELAHNRDNSLPKLKQEVTVDIHVIVGDDDADKSNNGNELYSGVKSSDSDVEVISNPSQGSVEVISDPSHDGIEVISELSSSSNVVCTSALTPITNVTISQTAGLSDSMSSGSMEASVCTLYNTSETGKSTLTMQTLALSDHEVKPSDNSSFDASIASTSPSHALMTPQTLFDQSDFDSSLEECLTFLDYCQPFKNINTAQSFTSSNDNDGPVTKESSASLLTWLYSKCVRNDSSEMPEFGPGMQHNSGKIAYSYKNFSKIDHRIKLFMDMMVIEDPGEEIFCLLKADILPFDQRKIFPGLLVFSNKKLYIMKITNREGDQPEKWLKRIECISLVELCKVSVILGDQGLILSFQNLQPYLFLLKDSARTSNFISWLQSHLPGLHGCDFTIDDIKTMQLSTLVALMSCSNYSTSSEIFYSLCYFKENDVWSLSNLIIIENDILIETKDLGWLIPSSLNNFCITTQQTLSNLVSVILYENFPLCLKLEFLMEDTEESIQWMLGLETLFSVKRFFECIRQPWEEIFGVELELNIETYCFQ